MSVKNVLAQVLIFSVALITFLLLRDSKDTTEQQNEALRSEEYLKQCKGFASKNLWGTGKKVLSAYQIQSKTNMYKYAYNITYGFNSDAPIGRGSVMCVVDGNEIRLIKR